jgi:hypothetical protein
MFYYSLSRFAGVSEGSLSGSPQSPPSKMIPPPFGMALCFIVVERAGEGFLRPVQIQRFPLPRLSAFCRSRPAFAYASDQVHGKRNLFVRHHVPTQPAQDPAFDVHN